MKKIFLILTFFGFLSNQAQDDKLLNIGLVLGTNYTSTENLTILSGVAGFQETIDASKQMGYHGGIYLQVNFNEMYLRPEVIYSVTNTSFGNTDLTQTSIDIPVLYGFKLIGPISMFGGPSFQYVLESDLKDIDYQSVDIEKDLMLNLQLGLGVNLGKQLRLDVRYEKGVADNIISFNDGIAVDGFQYNINAKPEQYTINLSLQL